MIGLDKIVDWVLGNVAKLSLIAGILAAVAAWDHGRFVKDRSVQEAARIKQGAEINAKAQRGHDDARRGDPLKRLQDLYCRDC